MYRLFFMILFALICTDRGDAKGCTNFAGTWEGKCSHNDGYENTDTLTIQQLGCHDFTIRGEKFEIDRPSILNSGVVLTRVLTWQMGDTELRLTGSGILHEPVTNVTAIRHVWRLENGVLRLSEKRNSFISLKEDSEETSTSGWTECSYAMSN